MSETIVESMPASREDANVEPKEEDDKPGKSPSGGDEAKVEEDDVPPSDNEDEGSVSKPDAAGANGGGAGLRPKQMLDVGFQPHQNDVLCGRGKTYREWQGNERFRTIVEAHLDEYKVAIGRSEKGVILTRVVEAVRNQEGATGFLKQGAAGQWYEVGDFYAREKTSQMFRDCLHESYSSSNMTKKKKRQEERLVMDQMKRSRGANPRDNPLVDMTDISSKTIAAMSASMSLLAGNLPGMPGSAAAAAAAAAAAFPFFGVDPTTAATAAALNASKQRVAFTAALAAKAGLAAGMYNPNGSMSSPQSPATKKKDSLERDVASVLQQLAGVSSGTTSSLFSSTPDGAAALAGAAAPDQSLTPSAAVASSSSIGTKPLFRSIPGPGELTICALQPELRGADMSPLEAATRVLDTIERISSRKLVDVFVLPELCPLGYGPDTFSKFIPRSQLIKDMLVLIDEAFAMRAQRLNVYICYGTIGWKDEDGREVYTIRQKVVDRSGKVAAVYDKMFLRDSDAVVESEYFVPGPPTPVSFQVDQFSLGLMICSDLRYPHLARSLARDHGVDALLNPSSYVRDRSFRAWKTFREARALENSVYVVGVNYAGDAFGQSSITPPWIDSEHEPDDLGVEDGFLIGKVERSILDLVRTSMPFHRQLTAELPKA